MNPPPTHQPRPAQPHRPGWAKYLCKQCQTNWLFKSADNLQQHHQHHQHNSPTPTHRGVKDRVQDRAWLCGSHNLCVFPLTLNAFCNFHGLPSFCYHFFSLSLALSLFHSFFFFSCAELAATRKPLRLLSMARFASPACASERQNMQEFEWNAAIRQASSSRGRTLLKERPDEIFASFSSLFSYFFLLPLLFFLPHTQM